MAGLAASLEEEGRREFRRLLGFSAVAHAGLLLALLLAPTGPTGSVLPGVVSVDLVSLPGPEPAPAPPAQRAVPPAERPAPPVEKPAPRVAKKVVLPEEPRQPIEPPAPVAPKPAPRPEPKPTPPPPSKPEAAPEYEDLLAQLREERGEVRPEQLAPAPRAGAGQAGAGGRGVAVGPEVAAWLRQARNHVRRAWVLAPGFRTELLETHVEAELDAGGKVIGEPRVTRRAGNPWYDESVIRAIQKASPLPAPPDAGRWPFVFRPEEY
jgi:TonB family protein